MGNEFKDKFITKNRLKNYWWVFLVLSFIIMAGSILILINKTSNLLIEKHNLISVYEPIIKEKTIELKWCQEELVKTTNQLTEIKVDHNLLQDDMMYYIDNTFQFIPRIVVVNIVSEILKSSKKYGVSPELIMAIIEVESSFNPMAISKANARGLMQVMPIWAKKFKLNKVSDLHDIDIGIDCGTKVLKIHIDEEGGDLTKGLYKYVGGSNIYAEKVYKAIGKFVAYRSIMLNKKVKNEDYINDK